MFSWTDRKYAVQHKYRSNSEKASKKIKSKDELVILVSTIGESCRKEVLNKKLVELEKISEVIDKLDAHYGFYFLKNCFSIPNILFFCLHFLVFCSVISCK